MRQLVYRNSVLEQLLYPGGEGDTMLDLDTKIDAASQTETHPVSDLIRPDYR